MWYRWFDFGGREKVFITVLITHTFLGDNDWLMLIFVSEFVIIIRMKSLYCLLIFYLFSYYSNAQEVEHNYLVGPQITNCDSLDLYGFSMSESITLIRSTKFRFDQLFRLTRKQGLQLGEYYSCNGKDGFLIIKYDGDESLYVTVAKEIWSGIISSSDPEGYYHKIEEQLHKYP